MHNYRPALIGELRRRAVEFFTDRSLPKYEGKQCQVLHYIKRLCNIGQVLCWWAVSFRSKSITFFFFSSPTHYYRKPHPPTESCPTESVRSRQPNQRVSRSFKYDNERPPCVNGFQTNLQVSFLCGPRAHCIKRNVQLYTARPRLPLPPFHQLIYTSLDTAHSQLMIYCLSEHFWWRHYNYESSRKGDLVPPRSTSPTLVLLALAETNLSENVYLPFRCLCLSLSQLQLSNS